MIRKLVIIGYSLLALYFTSWSILWAADEIDRRIAAYMAPTPEPAPQRDVIRSASMWTLEAGGDRSQGVSGGANITMSTATRGASITMYGSDYFDKPGDIEFQTEPFKTFMVLKPDGVLEFKVPVDEAAREFAKVVKQEWPEYCGCKK